jgi:ribosome biogenesis GTPase
VIRKKGGERHLSQRQRGQIAYTERKRSEESMALHGDELLRCLGREAFGPEEEGLVIAHYGLNIEVEDGQGGRCRCAVRKSATGEPVCGDRVFWMRAEGGLQGVINRILPRRSVLQRPLTGQRLQVIAANVDRIWVVFAATEPNMGLLDRYLVAAGVAGIPALIVVNKMDLVDEGEAQARFDHYGGMGYGLQYVSTVDKRGMAALLAAMRGLTSVLVGESGTGKSSLLAEWVTAERVKIGEVSQWSGKGRHTTTVTSWYHLPGGGAVIDSPGIREFGLHGIEAAQVGRYFPDVAPWLDQCRFNDCHHSGEPGCAVQAAIARGEVRAERLQSLQRIQESLLQERLY